MMRLTLIIIIAYWMGAAGQVVQEEADISPSHLLMAALTAVVMLLLIGAALKGA